jgi:hypothetical protein
MSITPNKLINKKYVFNQQIFSQIFICENNPNVIYYGYENIESFEDNKFNNSETIMIENILKTLNDEEDSELYYNNNNLDYPNNIIAFDIFVKNDIHTIVIWKKEKSLFVLIDPNNNDFITRYKNILNNYYSHFGTFEKLELRKNKLYESNTDKKYCDYEDNKQYARDCTDLSIKFCCVLKELHKNKINFETIDDEFKRKVTTICREIDDEKYKKLFKPFENTIIREQHSSKKDTRDEFEHYVNTSKVSSIFPDGFKNKNFNLKKIKEMESDTLKFVIEFNNKYNTNYNMKLYE